MGLTALRLFKLLVLVGTPLLGGVYAYQFMGQSSASQKLVPFKTFESPKTLVRSSKNPNGPDVEFKPTAPVTLVNFWATWCPPCVEEFPAMVELQRQLKDKGFEVVFVSVDDDWKKVQTFLAQNVIDVAPEQMFWDPTHSAASSWGSEKFPESYVVRRDGWVVEKIIGQQAWTRPSVVEYFEGLGSKFSKLASWWPSTLSMVSEAFAEPSNSGASIHEKDRKTLETLRKNIEVADKNLRSAEGALKTEARSVSEQESILKRRTQDVQDAQKEFDDFESRLSELRLLKQKYETSLRVEKGEQGRVEDEIKSSRESLSALEKRVEELKDKLAQLQKTLNTRRESVKTSEEALQSANSEMESFAKKKDGAVKVLNSQKSEQSKAVSLLKERQTSVKKLESKIDELGKVLADQKKKLEEAEKIINE